MALRLKVSIPKSTVEDHRLQSSNLNLVKYLVALQISHGQDTEVTNQTVVEVLCFRTESWEPSSKCVTLVTKIKY